MKKRSQIPALLACLAVAVLLAAGIVSLFLLRFQEGDVYPAYSSLRADPLGTRVLHDSLALCAGVSVERNFSDLNRLLPSADATLLLLGDTTRGADAIPRTTAAAINSFVRRGGRMVITFLPRNRSSEDPEEDETGEGEEGEKEAGRPPQGADDETGESGKAGSDEEEEEDDRPGNDKVGRSLTMGQWLQVDFEDDAIPGEVHAQRAAGTGPRLPQAISCHTSLFFAPAPAPEAPDAEEPPAKPTETAPTGIEGWTTIYERDGKPVIIERRLGKGSIVLATPTYFVSNEAMLRERHPALLAWMVGNHGRVVFDEWHHGVSKSPNIASLAWSYNLQWSALLLVLLAVLFIWRNGVGLVPPDATGPGEELAAGRDSASGLANLLRRNVPRGRVLDVCFTEWRRVQPHIGPGMHPNLARVQALVDVERGKPPGARRLPETYNQISELLVEEGKKAD